MTGKSRRIHGRAPYLCSSLKQKFFVYMSTTTLKWKTLMAGNIFISIELFRGNSVIVHELSCSLPANIKKTGFPSCVSMFVTDF